MIGFKTIEDYTFDDCVDFIDQHDSSHPLWEDINHRHSQLLRNLKLEDERCFNACKTFVDYENYITRFSNIKGATNYKPINIAKAKARMSMLPDLRQSWIKRHLGFLTKNYSLRNPITNLFLYLLLITSFIGCIVSIPSSIWSINLFTEDNWSIIDAYGKGFIPGLLLCMVTFAGVLNLIRWKKSGISTLIIGYVFVLFPLMFNEFDEFIAFSAPALLGCLLLWGIMCIKKKGISSWLQCAKIPEILRTGQFTFIGLWLIIVLVLPFIVALTIGFTGNLYSNGARAIDAYLNSSPYYSYDLYQKILLGSDYSDDIVEKKNTAEKWLLHSQSLNERNQRYEERFDDEFSQPMMFLNNLIYLVKNKSHQEAMEYINTKKSNIDMYSVLQYLKGEKYVMGEYEYYRPNKDKISSLLNECDIYEVVVDSAVVAEPYEAAVAE